MNSVDQQGPGGPEKKINDNEHWCGVVIYPPGDQQPREANDHHVPPAILILNSLEDGAKDEVVQVMREYLACERREGTVSRGTAFCPRTFQVSNPT